MKNNEILISAKFEGNGVSEELSFLVLKDITLKSLIQAVYYGLKKLDGHEKTFDLLTEYLQTRKELQVLYNSRGDFNVIDFTETADGKPVYDKALDELGIVTSTCLYFTLDTAVRPRALFRRVESSYILRSGDSLEYNISTRRLNVIESSVIDILPPGEMPGKDKGSLLDVLIPTLLSTGGMLAARFLIMQFSKSAASMGDTMLLMSGAMGIVALVTSLYNYLKKKNEYRASVGEWKTNYENYIHRMISTIKEWQVSDIKYLNSMYPSMDTLFKNTAEINGALFSRSQNDNDFMRITLGTSDEVKPLFEIRSEKKDNIFYDIYYKKIGDRIQIRIPSKKEKKRRKHMTAAERAREDKNQFLLTDLPYVFANKGVDSEDVNEVVGFNYLRSDDGTKPPLLLDLRTSGVLGVVSNDDRTSRNFIQHIVFELSLPCRTNALRTMQTPNPTPDRPQV